MYTNMKALAQIVFSLSLYKTISTFHKDNVRFERVFILETNP